MERTGAVLPIAVAPFRRNVSLASADIHVGNLGVLRRLQT